MIKERNIYFNRKEYEKAAEQYEKTGHWSVNNSVEKEIAGEAFCLAMNSWLSAFKVENAFNILEKEIFDDKFTILKNLYKKLEKMEDFLIHNNKAKQVQDLL